MKSEFAGRVCVVTGASRGIGAAIALKLAGHGCKIALNYQTREDMAQEQADKIISIGGEVILVRADIREAASVADMFKMVIERWQKVDILINNAGVTVDSLLLRMADKAWDDVISTNLKGPFLCTRQALRSMLRQDWGRVINIASVAGLMGNVGQSNYAASKSGLIGFTKSIAKEVGGHNITVNAIAPGFITTEMTSGLMGENLNAVLSRVPLRRLGLPDDVANTALFLCSEGASYITGQVLTVDGGVSIS